MTPPSSRSSSNTYANHARNRLCPQTLRPASYALRTCMWCRLSLCRRCTRTCSPCTRAREGSCPSDRWLSGSRHWTATPLCFQMTRRMHDVILSSTTRSDQSRYFTTRGSAFGSTIYTPQTTDNRQQTTDSNYVSHHVGAGWEPRRPMSRGIGGGFPRVRHAQHRGQGTEKWTHAPSISKPGYSPRQARQLFAYIARLRR